MAVRNFYVSGTVDGRKTDIGTGPRNKAGGMELVITQRMGGDIGEVFTISSYVRADGSLVTEVCVGIDHPDYEKCGPDLISRVVTER